MGTVSLGDPKSWHSAKSKLPPRGGRSSGSLRGDPGTIGTTYRKAPKSPRFRGSKVGGEKTRLSIKGGICGVGMAWPTSPKPKSFGTGRMFVLFVGGLSQDVERYWITTIRRGNLEVSFAASVTW